MKTIDIDTFPKFHNIIQKYNDNTIYRGVSNASYELLAKVGRKHCVDNYNRNNKYTDLIDYESAIIDEFKKYASEFVANIPSTPWEWWAIAQHHGLPTRYLDWTKNPLIAAYFAVDDCNTTEDCVVYAVDSTQFNSNIDFQSYPTPLDIDEVFLYLPPHINRRIVAQSGIFTVHNKPNKSLDQTEKPAHKIIRRRGENYNVDKIVIKVIAKQKFKEILSLYGINKSTVYPGLDGIAGHLEWRSLEC